MSSPAQTQAKASELLQRIPGGITAKWPLGERFVLALHNGSMSVELYAPVDTDPQTPHEQDELYFIHSGTGTLVIAGQPHQFEPGTCFFVPARVEHNFQSFSPDFSTWVVFWGPVGGESAAVPQSKTA